VRGNVAGALDFQQTREHLLAKDKS
jgi:hypothetical protein